MSWQQSLVRHLASFRRPLLVVLGPTASGKTGYSLRLAQNIAATSQDHRWNAAEIVNADSRQLYRGLDVGTAKMTQEEQQRIAHHLFDVLEPEEEVTIAWYKERAMKVIDEILARKHVPILVGGSMLYLSAIIDGLEPLPSVDPELRRKLEQEYDADEGVVLYQRLKEEDPDTAMAFGRRNKPYVVRAVEIMESTGKKTSDLKRQSTCPYDLLLFGMAWDRAEITRRIDERTRTLLEGGWIEEVLALRQHDVHRGMPAMKSHGYREVLAAIERYEMTGLSGQALLDAVKSDTDLYEVIAAKTRQYAKRQMTWWRNDPRIHWIRP